MVTKRNHVKERREGACLENGSQLSDLEEEPVKEKGKKENPEVQCHCPSLMWELPPHTHTHTK